LPRCIERTDRKLNDIAKKHRMSQLFHALREQLREERAQAEEVKLIQGRRILKELLNNYKLSILKQKEEFRMQEVSDLLYENKALTFFDTFR
jgi:hypothetical protein